VKPDAWPAVTLVCGEELLCKKAYKLMLDVLVSEDEQALGIETYDGNDTRIDAPLASINTYALLSGSKVVVFRDARILYSTQAQKGLKEKMEQSGQDGAFKKAARSFLNLMALLNLTFDDLKTPSLRKKVMEDVDGQPSPWFSQLIDYCLVNKLSIPVLHDDAALLQAAMDKGFPEGHRLVITTDIVDRRKALFKAIDAKGLIVDCTVPKGESRTDRLAQDEVSLATIDELLAKARKRMASEGRRRILEWTGFDLRTLSGNLEKLISFVGDRKTITDDDVVKVLRRTRKDPIFEFTNAVADRNLSSALSTMKGLLDEGMHPLQLLSAIANQVRRLVIARDFITRDGGRTWSDRLSFPQFKSGPFKTIQADDQAFLSQLMSTEADENASAGKKKKKKSPATDLFLAKNARSPYPVFQTLKKAGRFPQHELVSAMIALSDIDLKMKSGGQDSVLLLEKFLLRFCRG
jgi:DNA polymerase-3 subunit delta